MLWAFASPTLGDKPCEQCKCGMQAASTMARIIQRVNERWEHPKLCMSHGIAHTDTVCVSLTARS